MGGGMDSRKFFSWHDQQYRDFMIDLMSHLMPRFEKRHTVIYDELDEFIEIIFV